MVVFILQSLFLIAAAFIVGAILGNLFKRFSPRRDSVSERSTRAADARLASSSVLPANDDVKRSAQAAAAMTPPAEPVPPLAPAVSGRPARSARKSPLKKSQPAAVVKRLQNPRQDDKHRPVALKAARRGNADNLTSIDGIGNAIQSRLFDLGIFHYDQIAGWTFDEATWISEEIGFPGRAHREDWMKQAVVLVGPAGGLDKGQGSNTGPKRAVRSKGTTKSK